MDINNKDNIDIDKNTDNVVDVNNDVENKTDTNNIEVVDDHVYTSNVVNNISGDSNGSIRRTMIIVLIACMVLGGIIYILSHSNNSGSSLKKVNLKYNDNKEFLKEKKIEDLLFSNVKCSYDGENSVLSYVIVNQSDKTVHLDEYEIVISDKDGNVLTTINPNYDYDLKEKERFETSNSVSVDLTKATKFDIKLHSGVKKEEATE